MSEDANCNDERVRRCPMLGHRLEFAYCRNPEAPLPCRKIFDCWWETFDITSYMERWYGEEKIKEILRPPKTKVLSLAELIEKARKK
jgi:hypothetical protein